MKKYPSEITPELLDVIISLSPFYATEIHREFRRRRLPPIKNMSQIILMLSHRGLIVKRGRKRIQGLNKKSKPYIAMVWEYNPRAR